LLADRGRHQRGQAVGFDFDPRDISVMTHPRYGEAQAMQQLFALLDLAQTVFRDRRAIGEAGRKTR